MSFIRKVLVFILYSSKDPSKTSASIKYALLLAVPYLLTSLDLACAIGQYCYDIDRGALEEAAEGIAQIAYLVFFAVGSIGAAYSLGRKVIYTLTGRNAALNSLK